MHRLLAHHDLLRPLPAERIADAVDHAVLAAATATHTPYVGLHARLLDFHPEMLDRRLFETKEIVKVHAFRGSFFLVLRSMLATVLAASKPGREKVCQAYRRERRVSEATWRRLRDAAVHSLGGGAKDARELAKAMGAGKLPPTFLRMLSVEGTLVPWTPVHAPAWESSTHRLAVRSVLFPELDEADIEAARTLLLRRYLEAYGPASVKDIAWWLDVGAKTVEDLLAGIREGLAWSTDEDTSQAVVGLALRLPNPAAKVPAVLVPGADHVPRAFRERDFFLRPEWYDQVVTYDGNPKASVWVDGEIRGRWQLVRGGSEGHVVVWRFAAFSGDAERAVKSRARHIATFAGLRPGKVYFQEYPAGLPASGSRPPLPRELAADRETG